MAEENQAPPSDPIALPGDSWVPFRPEPTPDPEVARARRGLALWVALLLVFGVGGLILGQPEVAGLVALGGMFAAAHAADLDPGWRRAYGVLGFLPSVGGVVLFGSLAISLLHAELAPAARAVAVVGAAAGVVGCGLTAAPAALDALVRRLFGGATPSFALRLGAQLALAGVLLALPGWFAFAAMRDTLLESGGPLLAKPQLAGSLVGYLLLALGGVGFGVRRDLRSSLERLGVRAPKPAHLLAVIAGVAGLALLNVAGEAIQRHWFPGLWRADNAISKMLARGLTPAHIVLLGLSAGIGEEIVLRGGLQPRLGIVRTALVFASLHIQYSWFGMSLVFLLGVTLGLIRRHTNTSVAMIVHGLYDMLAVFAS